MSVDKKPFVLVDGSSYLFRAYHALPPLNNSKGVPTGAVYGVINMLRRLVADYEPDYMAVVFDPKGKTFRNDLYEAYKANRDDMPDELRVQIQPLFAVIKALGLPLVIVDGYEADDVIATLAKQAEKQGLDTIVSTGDKDLAQLVNKHVTLINTMNNKVMDITGVKEKFGVPPERIIDYLTLVGDTSDNIPGVPKVGPKTAAKWLNEYGSLDNIIEQADSIKGKVGEYFREFIPQIPLTRELVTVVGDIELEQTPKTLTLQPRNTAELKKLFSELEFRKWLAEVSDAAVEEAGISDAVVENNGEYETILTQKQWDVWLAELKQSDVFAFDTETSDLNAMQASLVGMSFATKNKGAAYLPLAHDYLGAPKQLDRDQVLKDLQAILADKQKTIVGQNLKYDLKILRHYGITVAANMRDTLLESYVLNSARARHDLDTLALDYLGRSNIKFEDVAGKGAKQLTFNQVELDKATPYAAEDADVALALDRELMPQLEKVAKDAEVFSTIEMPLMPILMEMEYYGVLLDVKKLVAQSKLLEKRIHELTEEIYAIASEEFNIDSTKQLREILFEKLGLPILKKTPKGQASTAENVMQELALDYPLPKMILEYRSLTKLKSTYTDKLPKQVNVKTKRIHTHYNQAVTSTGRLSSKDPNLQNIPVRNEEGRKIRQAFIAPKGFKLLAADYSQIELRLMADLSKDPGLLKAFKNGWDVHASTAAEVFGVPLDQVTPEQRRGAKAINFGLMYGMSAFGLSQQLGIDRASAQQHMQTYFKKYPNVQAYMDKTREKAAKQGYVDTLFGRRIMVPDIKSSNGMRRKAAERAAINAPLQGTAADIIKVAMICVHQWLQKTNSDVRMIMQVHDELVFEVPENQIEDATQHIRDCMVNAVKLSVPLEVHVGVGDDWDKAH